MRHSVGSAFLLLTVFALLTLATPAGAGGESLELTMPARMVHDKTFTLKVVVLDSVDRIDWRTWTALGTVSAHRVSDGAPLAVTVTTFETNPNGIGGGGPPTTDSIRFYNGLGTVSFTFDNPASAAGQDVEVTVTLGSLSASGSMHVVQNTPGLFRTLSGPLGDADVTWSPADGVIHLTGTVTVGGSRTLTIEPGTLIMVDAGAANNGTAIELIDNASVSAIGTEDSPIFFFATAGPAAMVLPQTQSNNTLSWRGIDHGGSATSNYAHVFLTGAGNGFLSGHLRPLILHFGGSSSVNISDSVFADCPGKILHGSGDGTYVISRSVFSRNGIGGEFIGDNHNLTIEDCYFHRIGRALKAFNVDGDFIHLDNATSTQLVRRTILADGGDDAIDHNFAFPVIEDMIIWSIQDKAVSLTGGGITIDNLLVFDTDEGIRGCGDGVSSTITVANSTIAVPSRTNCSGGSMTVTHSIFTGSFYTGSCSGNIDCTLGANTVHIPCGTGNASGDPQFVSPGLPDRDYTPGPLSPAMSICFPDRVGWLGFPDPQPCTGDVDCDDGQACTLDTCDTGVCVHEGQAEVCDGVDNDCDGGTDEIFPDTDLDTLADCTDPDDDNDGVDDVSDCAPFDPSATTDPVDVTDLRLFGGGGGGPTLLYWTGQGGEFVYDVVAGSLAALRLDDGAQGAQCAADDVAGSAYGDWTGAPLAGGVRYFLVRAENACGVSSYGKSSAGAERLPAIGCP